MRAQERPETIDGPDRVRQAARATAPTPSFAHAGSASALSAEEVLTLQRTIGNAATARVIEQQHVDGVGVQRSVHDVLGSPGRPLDAPLRAEMEARLGADFTDVRLHTDTTAQRSATELDAHAYTSGNHVVIGPGATDKHTLAHELTHVIQQRQGPVTGTDIGAGVSVSDPADHFERAAAANADRVMSGPVPAQRHAATTPAGVATEAPVVQRKGGEEIETRVTAASKPRGMFGRLGSLLTAPAPTGPALDRVKQEIKAYDTSTVREPLQCIGLLMPILQATADCAEEVRDDPAGQRYLQHVRDAVEQEKMILAAQIERAEEHPEADRPPYEQMTDQGALWQESALADSATNYGMSGSSYFMELSELNRSDMAAEIQAGKGGDWVTKVTNDLERQLRSSVLSHYTTQPRAEAMVVGDKKLKSKTVLEQETPDAPNNTQGYDSVALANDAFTFWFIEPGGRTDVGRDTRFGKDQADPDAKPARIELDILDSGLLTSGWIMLSDFAQREYPVLEADRADRTHTRSYLPTRKPTDQRDTVRMREFQRGDISDEDLMESITAFAGIEDGTERQVRGVARQQAVTDSGNRMVYGPEPNPIKYPELLHHNVLMGKDIIPGLTQRAVVEIMRLEKVNPQLAKRLKTMPAMELMAFLLKDLVRPQAMIPNAVDLTKARVNTG